MKLQFLGDSRDAFKWDLLHWICTRADPPFAKLVFVPLLTPDEPDSREGKTPHTRFECRPPIWRFVQDLGRVPRTLERVATLGDVEEGHRFAVTLFGVQRTLGAARWRYWDGFKPADYQNAIVFFDPDTGLETKTQHGAKWLLHCELARWLDHLGDDSAVVVYQHRPRRAWMAVFDDLSNDISYAPFAAAAFESNLAFLTLARASGAAARVQAAMKAYSKNNPIVNWRILRSAST